MSTNSHLYVQNMKSQITRFQVVLLILGLSYNAGPLWGQVPVRPLGSLPKVVPMEMGGRIFPTQPPAYAPAGATSLPIITKMELGPAKTGHLPAILPMESPNSSRAAGNQLGLSKATSSRNGAVQSKHSYGRRQTSEVSKASANMPIGSSAVRQQSLPGSQLLVPFETSESTLVPVIPYQGDSVPQQSPQATFPTAPISPWSPVIDRLPPRESIPLQSIASPSELPIDWPPKTQARRRPTAANSVLPQVDQIPNSGQAYRAEIAINPFLAASSQQSQAAPPSEASRPIAIQQQTQGPAIGNEIIIQNSATAPMSTAPTTRVQNNNQTILLPPAVAAGSDCLTGDCLQNSATPILPGSPIALLKADALFITREGGSVTWTNTFGVDPFDFEMGLRLTAQRVRGADGLSITYTGLQEWNGVRRVNSPTNSLNVRSVTGGGLSATALAPFQTANFQQQYHNGSFHSIEVNRVTWGWDVLNLFTGIRYSHYQEEFDFFSSRADGQQGRLLLDMENHMFGPQVGGEIFYDIGGPISTGVTGKLGLMANALDGQTQLISNGLNAINVNDSDVTMNIMAEFEAFFRYQIRPQGFVRAGYSLWYNSAVYSVNDNLPAVITPAYGTNTLDDDLFIHGLSIGLEFVW